MTRMLLIEDDVPAAELTVHRLESAGLAFEWERVAGEAAFRAALARTPDIILSDSDVAGFTGMAALGIAKQECPGTRFVFVSGHLDDAAAKRALHAGASAYVAKSDAAGLAATVHTALRRRDNARRDGEQRKLALSTAGASGIAGYLVERREVLDRTLQHQDRSPMSTIMRRTPPSPMALLAIDNSSVRERFGKLLRNANIEIDEVNGAYEALAQLEHATHAVMLTDRLDLIRQSRHLHSGAATHVLFVGDDGDHPEALRAGANGCMSGVPDGDEFWAQMTTARRIVSLAASLQLALSDNRILSTVDELTGCGSRRFFEQEFPREVERATRLGRALALVMCDIDHFKKVNDGHGHQTGDEVLSEFGERLRAGLRLGQDWLARVGGEEFAIVLPETSDEESLRIAERLRERIRATPFRTRSSTLRVTASFGVCAIKRRWRNATGIADSIIHAADSALYESKRAGRDRVTTSGPIG